METRTSMEIRRNIQPTTDRADAFNAKKWVSVDDVKAWLECCMTGESHNKFREGYYQACKDFLEQLEGEGEDE
jgi:hypothetical protein